MQPLRARFVAATAVVALIGACTARDSLLDSGGGGESGAPAAGATAGNGGSGQASGGVQSNAGASGTGGVTTGGGGGTAGGGAGAEAGAGVGGSGATGGTEDGGGAGVGAAGTGSGTSGAGGSAGTGQCPEGQVCAPCSDATTLEECEARSDCHSVFEDPRNCRCADLGCCARFAFCADGDKAECGAEIHCDQVEPYCESPAYVVSSLGTCYEGCVAPKDCARTCARPDDPAGCECYLDIDCAAGQRCYLADCENQRPGVCRVPPPQGCFGDADCPQGQTCIGGRPTACASTAPDVIGTCGVEACPEGDCPGVGGDSCTCSDGTQCIAATGATGSGVCRGADGICFECECAAPDTPISTPDGERAMAELEVGDLVYSVDGEAIRVVPILRVNRTPVANHQVLRVTFANGRSFEMSARHPLADGRPLSALQRGSEILGETVTSVTRVPYAHAATYDILPASSSGAYFASGVLVGSTLASVTRRPGASRERIAPP